MGLISGIQENDNSEKIKQIIQIQLINQKTNKQSPVIPVILYF